MIRPRGSGGSAGRLDGKVAIVSGGARGIGAACVTEIVAQGGRVVFGDVLDEQGQAGAHELGDAARYVHLDVREPEDWAAAVVAAETAFGPVAALVNNAGIVGPRCSVEDYPIAGLQEVLSVNLIGTLNGMQAVVPSMRAAGEGSIVNISSAAGMLGYLSMSGYAASKFAVRGLTKCGALDLGKYRIRVNSVHPGLIRTPMAEGISYPLDHVALKREGAAGEVARLVCFLAGDDSSFSTGGEFLVDGGELSGNARPLV